MINPPMIKTGQAMPPLDVEIASSGRISTS